VGEITPSWSALLALAEPLLREIASIHPRVKVRSVGNSIGADNADLPLRSGTDNYLVHINIGRLLDRERNSAGDRIRRHRKLVPGLDELGFHLRTGHTFREVRPDEARNSGVKTAQASSVSVRSAGRIAGSNRKNIRNPVLTNTP
jgi:hypothetical protein